MQQSKFAGLVHWCNRDGHLAWFVGYWDEEAAEYQHPLSAAERRANPGASAWYSKGCDYMPHFETRTQALRHARYIWGSQG